jgi:hypothetical protein
MSTIDYSNEFIASLILSDDFQVESYDEFVAKMGGQTVVPKMRGFDLHWSLCFNVVDGQLTWTVVEYKNDYDEHGSIEMDGLVRVALRDEPYLKCGPFEVYNEDAYEFVATLFPIDTKVVQLYPDENMFLVGEMFYNFDTMMSLDRRTNEKKHIHFEFI